MQVGEGKSFTVVRRSRPVFRVVPVDEWGDEGEWKTLVDFSHLKDGGINATDFLKLLRHEQKR